MKKLFAVLIIFTALALSLTGCGKTRATESEAAVSVPQATPSETPEPVNNTGRKDGERFEAVIIMEGMEETVPYEHIRNDALGFEMDYDYESFVRKSEPNRECFLSVWDDFSNPENYLVLTSRSEDAESVAAAVRADLSQTYDLFEESRELERAGSCIYIEASVLKGTGRMADQLQIVYIIPASDGCRVATAHFAAEASEGFGRRFAYMLNTLVPVAGSQRS